MVMWLVCKTEYVTILYNKTGKLYSNLEYTYFSNAPLGFLYLIGLDVNLLLMQIL